MIYRPARIGVFGPGLAGFNNAQRWRGGGGGGEEIPYRRCWGLVLGT